MMTVPDIGTMTARAFKAAIDDPKRFTSSTKVGPYLGLTPRQYQPGESEWIGGRRPLQIGLRGTGARGRHGRRRIQSLETT
jgi:transposase